MSEAAAFSARALLQALIAGRVEFVVVGGLAAQAHGSPIITQDLDICHGLDRANLDRLTSVLSDLTATRRGLPVEAVAPLDARALRASDVLTLQTRYGDLDLLAHPDPNLDFDALRSRAIRFDLAGATVWIASLDDLISMKRAAGRPKDLLALEHLGALREERDRRP